MYQVQFWLLLDFSRQVVCDVTLTKLQNTLVQEQQLLVLPDQVISLWSEIARLWVPVTEIQCPYICYMNDW